MLAENLVYMSGHNHCLINISVMVLSTWFHATARLGCSAGLQYSSSGVLSCLDCNEASGRYVQRENTIAIHSFSNVLK